MTFTIDTKTLTTALKPLVKAIEKKTTIPVLAGIHIRSGEGRVQFTGTDLELAIVQTLEHDTDGLPVETVIIDGRGFIKAIAGKGQTTITIEETRVLVVCNGAQLAFPTMSAESYPCIPAPSPDLPMIGIAADNLARMINQTSYAISKEESRFTLNGALLEVTGALVRMVTTDGHRLAIADSALSLRADEWEKRTLIRRRALEVLSACKGNDTVYISRDLREETDHKGQPTGRMVPAHLFFTFGSMRIVARAMTGSFPDYERVIPSETGFTLRVDRKPLLATLQTASKYADERSHAVTLRLNGCCKVMTMVSDSPAFNADVPAVWDGPEDGEIAFNADYLVDFLKAQSADTVLFGFRPNEQKRDKEGRPMEDENGNAIMVDRWKNHAMDCYGDDSARAVIMPMWT